MLIVGGPDDAHAAAVARRLAERGARPAYLDFTTYPAATTLAWEPRGGGRLTLPGGEALALAELGAVYWRTAGSTRAPAGLRADMHEFAEQEARKAVEGMLRALPCPVINTPQAIAAHRFKPAQSAVVAALGVPTPATLIANDPDAVAAFAAAHPEGVIVKPVGGGAYARRLAAGDLARADSIRACPMQFQAYVPGEDVRVYVIGERVFAARIVTADPAHVDFRTDPTHHSVAVDPDPALARRCVEIARALGYAFTGVDFRRTDAGEHVFLEANPSPMFLRFAQDTGHPLLDALCDLLLQAARAA